MDTNLPRKQARLVRHIQKTTQLLEEWEDKKRVAENPSERERCAITIAQLEKDLEAHEQQLNTLSENKTNISINTTTMMIENIYTLIEKGRLKKAIEATLHLVKTGGFVQVFGATIRSISAQYETMESNEMMGILSLDEGSRERNKLNARLLQLLQKMKEEKQAHEQFEQAAIPQAITIIQPDASSAQLKKLQAQIDFLIQEHHGAVMELATLILNNADHHADTQEEIGTLLPMIKSIQASDSAEAKLKLAIPLLDMLGIAKVELETELKLNNPVKRALNAIKTRWA